MGVITIPIQMDMEEYQNLAQQVKEFNYLFNTNMDVVAYCEHLIKTQIITHSLENRKTVIENHTPLRY